MNTCIQDAFNIAWKLAMVIRGEAGPGLIKTYEEERTPVGRQIVLRANQSRLDYAPLKACFRVEDAENPVAAGIARFRDPGPEGRAARDAVSDALALKDREFNALGVELNQHYASSGILSDDHGATEPNHDAELDVHVSTRPGARLPHAWLVDAVGKRISTLDVVGKGQFTLVTGISGTAWVAAAAALRRPWLRIAVIGAADCQDVYCEWRRVREIEEDGALLVRPDGHVAWRSCEAPIDVEGATAALEAALTKILDLAGRQNAAAPAMPRTASVPPNDAPTNVGPL